MVVEEVMDRARSQIGRNIRYNLGCGGMNPNAPGPETLNHDCDCSGLACWCIGISRYHSEDDIWFNTDAICNDAKHNLGHFKLLDNAKIGCLIVYPSSRIPRKQFGHIGLVSEIMDGKCTKAIHCSAGNQGRYGYAVAETDASVFTRQPDTILVWPKVIKESGVGSVETNEESEKETLQ